MAIYVTSDLHFNHVNILPYEPIARPFATIEEMNEQLIKNWNETVTAEDDIYVIGDMFMGAADAIEPILKRLVGKIHLIQGNHDSEKRIKIIEPYCAEPVVALKYLAYKGCDIILCHFPLANEQFCKMVTNDGDNFNLLYLYGHIHSSPLQYTTPPNFIHIGIDTNDLCPVLLDKIVKEFREKK